MIQIKQIEMDNVINFDTNSILHTIASKTISTHIADREINKLNQVKSKKNILITKKVILNNKSDKKILVSNPTNSLKNNRFSTLTSSRK